MATEAAVEHAITEEEAHQYIKELAAEHGITEEEAHDYLQAILEEEADDGDWEAQSEEVRTLLVGALLGLSAVGLIGMLVTRARRGDIGAVAGKKGDVPVGLRARDVESKVSPADSADSPADSAPLIKKDD